jgi:hypothetical protein
MRMDHHTPAALSADDLELLTYLMEEAGLAVADRRTIVPPTQQTEFTLSCWSSSCLARLIARLWSAA